MRTYNITVQYFYEPGILEEPDGPPVRCFTTTRRVGHHGRFRVYQAIVRPQSKEAESNFALRRGEFEYVFKAVSDIVEFLNKKGGGDSSPRA